MPRLHAYATLTVAGAVAVTAELSVLAGDVPYEVIATLDLDDAPVAIAMAAPGAVQEAGFEVRVAGVAIPRDSLVGTIEVNRSRREAIQSANFTVNLDEWGVSPLGDPYANLGSPTGISEIDILGVYRNDATGTVYRYPLITRGVVDNVTRESHPEHGHTETYQVLDEMARFSRMPVTLILPPGHGLPTGRMQRKTLELAGDTHFALEDGRRRFKEVQLVDADPVASAQEWGDVEGRVLRKDRRGNTVNPELDPASPPAAVLTLTEDDFLEVSSVSQVIPCDAVTDVTVTGTEQIHGEAEEPCGSVTAPPVENKTFRVFAVPVCVYVQDGSCNLTATGESSEARMDLYSLTLSWQTKRCGVVQAEGSESWLYFNPEAARYYYTGGDHFCVNGVYLNGDATEEGSEPAFIGRRATWTMIGRSRKNHYYDAPDWYGPVFAGEGGANDFTFTATGGEPTGRRLGSVTTVEGYYNPQTAAKEQTEDPPVSFDTLDFRDVFSTGAGVTVRDSRETFIVTSRTYETVQAAGGYIQDERTFSQGYAILPNGRTYQYTDGSLSDTPDETFAQTNLDQTSYIPTGENQHKRITTHFPLGESPVTDPDEDVASAPPAVEYLPEYQDAQDQAFIGEEDATFGVTARAGETKPIKVQITAPDLLRTHLPRKVKTQYPYAEDGDELYGAGVRVIRESLVFSITGTLLANFLLAEDVRVNLTFRPLGVVAQDVVIDQIGYSGGPDEDYLTRVTFDLMPPRAA